MIGFVKILCTVAFVALIIKPSTANQIEITENYEVEQGRSWGHHFLKRVGVLLIPAAFVIGAVTTLLAALTIVSVKGLGVGLILLILTIGQMIARGIPAIAPTAYASPLPPPASFPVVYKTW